MSVILRRNEQIILYCKGADNVIYERLAHTNFELRNRTQDHLNVEYLRLDLKAHVILMVCSVFFIPEIRWRRIENVGACRKENR